MFTRFLLRTTTSVSTARMVMSRKASTASRQPVGPVRQFFRDVGVPVDAYPLVAIIVIVCSGATYMLSKHIIEDRSPSVVTQTWRHQISAPQ
ncbi:hypothetical protein L204_104561 [Cryptococcus depauperatus]